MIRKAFARKIRAAGGVLALAALLPAMSFAQQSDYPSGAAIRGSAGHHGGTHGYFDPKPGTPDPVAVYEVETRKYVDSSPVVPHAFAGKRPVGMSLEESDRIVSVQVAGNARLVLRKISRRSRSC